MLEADDRRRTDNRRFLLKIEIAALSLVAWPFLVYAFPTWVGIETWCGLFGSPTHAADVVTDVVGAGVVVTGALVFYVLKSIDRPLGVLWLVPPAWIAAWFAAETIVRLIIGPQHCTSEIGFI